MAHEATGLDPVQEAGTGVAPLVVADLVRSAPKARVLRHGQDEAAAGAHGAREFLDRALIIRNVLEHVEATDHIEKPKGARSQDVSLPQGDARQTLRRLGQALGIGINPGQFQVRLQTREALQHEAGAAAYLAEALRRGKIALHRPRDKSPAFLEPEMARLAARQPVEGIGIKGVGCGVQDGRKTSRAAEV